MLRKITTAIAAGALLAGVGLAGSASAAPAKPALNCPYGHICGVDADGTTFDFYRCGEVEPLHFMVGVGVVFNNQTPGTVAMLFADSQGSPYLDTTAPEAISVNWSDVAWIKAC